MPRANGGSARTDIGTAVFDGGPAASDGRIVRRAGVVDAADGRRSTRDIRLPGINGRPSVIDGRVQASDALRETMRRARMRDGADRSTDSRPATGDGRVAPRRD